MEKGQFFSREAEIARGIICIRILENRILKKVQ